ncbi:hypothetical protein RJZ56_006841 [Blastomyces dermatitidis]
MSARRKLIDIKDFSMMNWMKDWQRNEKSKQHHCPLTAALSAASSISSQWVQARMAPSDEFEQEMVEGKY